MASDGTYSAGSATNNNQIEFSSMPFAHFSVRPSSVKPLVYAMLALASATVSSQSIADEFKVAFIGDQGVSAAAQGVLELIRDEGADLLLIQGDLGYDDNTADIWAENINTILGDDFPVLLVVGNHENYEWPEYLQWQKDRLARTPEVRCEGDIGVKSYCTYKDLGVVLVSPGITEVDGVDGADDYEQYITDSFNDDDSTWRICSWHKNMRDMQVGGKGDATGWGVYQSCLAQGGIVVNGHEHSYSRTHLMSDFENLQVIHTDSNMNIGRESSIAIVSGLGGRQVRPQLHGGDWFASVYTETQGANHASLFCDFNGSQADCYLKDVAGLIPDQFTLNSVLDNSSVVEDSASVLADAQTEDQADAEAEMQADAEAEAQVNAEAEAQADADAEAQADAEAEAQADAEAEAQADAEAEAQADAEAEAQADAEAEAQADAEAEAQADADAEAQAAAEAEARAEAETEARAEAESEARAAAEAEEQAAAEAAAQAAAESEAREEAQAEAEAQAELDSLSVDADTQDDQQSDTVAIVVADPGTTNDELDGIPSSNIDGENAPVVNAEPQPAQSLDDGNMATDDLDNDTSSIASGGSSGGGGLGWLSLAGLALLGRVRRRIVS